MQKKIKVVFSQNALDNFDGTEEELQQIADELTKMILDSDVLDFITDYNPPTIVYH